MIFFKEFYRRLSTLRNGNTISKLPPCDVLLMCQDVDRGDEKDGLAYSKLIDSIHEELNEQGYACQQVILPPYSSMPSHKTWAKPYSANISFFFAWLFSVFSDKLGIKKLFKDEEDVYARIFQIAKPQMLFVIGAQPSLCRAARKNNIRVAEVLHGIGYDGIKWGWDNEPLMNLPHTILCLDQVSAQSFSPLREKGVDVTEIPHPWHKRFTADAPNKQLLDQKWIQRLDFLPKDKKVVLLSLVWGYDGDHGTNLGFKNVLKNGLIPEELIEVISKTADSVFWCIRRHPVHIRNASYNYQIKFLDKLIETHTNCEWRMSSQCSLISLFNSVDAHMSMISMTSYDAAFMGIKTLLLCPTLHKGGEYELLFDDLVAADYAVKGKMDSTDIYDWVANTKRTTGYRLTNANNQDWNVIVSKLYSDDWEDASISLTKGIEENT